LLRIATRQEIERQDFPLRRLALFVASASNYEAGASRQELERLAIEGPLVKSPILFS